MQPDDASDDLVVSTPERVTFQYPVAGLGSRFLAQGIDLAVLLAVYLVLALGASALGAALSSPRVALLASVLVSFVVTFGYFLVSEAVWSGQTVGKRALRLRVVGDHGEPLRFSQAVIRNLVRVVDFLPVMYAIGIITVFANARNKRLGDLAAGTLVVRERQRVSLFDLAGTAQAAPEVPGLPAPAPSIWDRPAAAASASPPATTPEDALRQLDPALRRLVVAYAARRSELPLVRRKAVADRAQGALQKALPEMVASAGPLAALDHLAEIEGITPKRAMQRRSTAALTFGVVSIIGSLFLFAIPLELMAIIAGILATVLATGALRAIRARPHEIKGEDRARTGRLLGIIGISISCLILLLDLAGTHG